MENQNYKIYGEVKLKTNKEITELFYNSWKSSSDHCANMMNSKYTAFSFSMNVKVVGSNQTTIDAVLFFTGK